MLRFCKISWARDYDHFLFVLIGSYSVREKNNYCIYQFFSWWLSLKTTNIHVDITTLLTFRNPRMMKRTRRRWSVKLRRDWSKFVDSQRVLMAGNNWAEFYMYQWINKCMRTSIIYLVSADYVWTAVSNLFYARVCIYVDIYCIRTCPRFLHRSVISIAAYLLG